MGIYISGLNMPDRYAQIVIHADGSVSVFDDDANCFQETKAKATNVPDHGDLIDRETCLDKISNENVRDVKPDMSWGEIDELIALDIITLPTIIPADVTNTNVGNICSGRGKPLPYER